MQPLPQNLSQSPLDFGRLVQGRRSIRRYQARPIDPLLLETLLDAAIWAPSAHNRQPWRFCVVTSDAAKQALSARMAEHWRADLGGDGADPAFIERRVAIKEFRKDIRYEDFFRELCIMCVVHHEHLVRCLGGVTKQQRRIIVMELMQCNLSDILAEQSIALDHGLRLRFLMDVAAALTYLHAHCNLIHRDLKTLNLLVTSMGDELVVKVPAHSRTHSHTIAHSASRCATSACRAPSTRSAP